MKRRAVCVFMSLWMAVSVPGTVLAEEGQDTLTKMAQEFAEPSQEVRPGIRYWMPAAAVEEEALRQDIQDIAALGYGSIEICSLDFFTAAIPEGYEWGSENWNKALEIIVDEAGKHDISVDVTNGNAYPIQMPGVEDADDEGSSYEITFSQTTLEAGQTYSGAIPERRTVRVAGTPKLLSAYAYRSAGSMTLDENGIIDLTSYIKLDEENHQNSTLEWTAPEDGDYELFFFFEQPTCQANGSFGEAEEGPYVVDHFGIAGAQACIDYWSGLFETNPELKEITNIFNDSIEIYADNEWTRGFREIFEEMEGYDIAPYLPLLGNVSYYNSVDGPGYSLTDSRLTNQIRSDYRQVLTYCLENYHLKPLQEFAESEGLGIRYQVSYNTPTDMVGSALYVSTPEVEGDSLDQLRYMASSVHMRENGNGLLSMEVGFENGNAYGQTYEDILWHIKRAWASGVNMEYLHGASYSGNWETPIETFPDLNGETSYWPGYNAWSTVVSNVWNRNTSSENAHAVIDYIARNNYVLQKNSKVDLAIYRETYTDFRGEEGDVTNAYGDGGLLSSNGYSYEYINTEILNLDTAVVNNGVLNETGPAYKALILNNQTSISYSAAAKIAELAEAGLPVIIVGESPSVLMYHSEEAKDGHSDQEVAAIFEKLTSQLPESVKQAPDYEAVPGLLKEMGIGADAEYETETDILARHMADGIGDYYYFYNYNKEGGYPALDKETLTEKDVTVTLAGEGKPYEMNAWNGEIKEITEYEEGETGVTVSLHFGKDETKLIVLLGEEEAEANGLTAAEQTILCEEEPEDIEISEWELTIDSITQGDTIYFRDSQWTTLEPLTVAELKSWAELKEEWETVSGIGTYTGSFTLENGWEEGYGAYLNIGEVNDTFTVEINGTELPAVDQAAERVDIGKYVHAGENTVVIRVASTLYNAVYKTVNPNDLYGYGLLGKDGKVTVTPYQCL